MDQKHNPDVLPKFNEINNARPNKFTPTDVIWKKITPGDQVPDKSQDPSTEKVMTRLDEELHKREKEKKFVRRKNNRKLEPLQDEETSKEAVDFQGLKKLVINENDKLQREKETFNKLLGEINEII